MHAAPRGAARGARARAVADGRRAEVDHRPSGRRSRHMWVSGAILASGQQLQLVWSTPALSLNWLRNGRNRRVTQGYATYLRMQFRDSVLWTV